MKEIIKYQAEDGQLFDNREECFIYEQLIIKIAHETQRLDYGNPSVVGSFSEGDYFIQQDKDVVDSVKVEMLVILHALGFIIQYSNDLVSHIDFMLLKGYTDGSIYEKPFRKILYRLACIDSEYREWGQYYFKLNPTKSDALKNKK